MTRAAQHPEPADAAARRAIEPVTVYTVDKVPPFDRRSTRPFAAT